MIENYRTMELLLGNQRVHEILDKRAFTKFWSEHHRDYKDAKPKRYSDEQIKWIKQILSELSSVERLIIHLRYWEDLCVEEISSFLRCQLKTITRIEQETLLKLRELYQQDHAIQGMAMASV